MPSNVSQVMALTNVSMDNMHDNLDHCACTLHTLSTAWVPVRSLVRPPVLPCSYPFISCLSEYASADGHHLRFPPTLKSLLVF